MATRCKKRGWPDKKSALKALHYHQNKNDGFSEYPVRVYLCPLCINKWHMTKKAIDEDKEVEYKLKFDWSGLISIIGTAD
jgi:hypothetical protein